MNKSHRARSWVFTLNNYTIEDINTLTHPDFKTYVNKFCFQEEIGENENKHLQGVINFKNPRHFDKMKELLPKAHWEQCRNLKRSLVYCSKEDTRNGEIFVHNYQAKSHIKIDDLARNEELLRQMLQHLKDNPIDIPKNNIHLILPPVGIDAVDCIRKSYPRVSPRSDEPPAAGGC